MDMYKNYLTRNFWCSMSCDISYERHSTFQSFRPIEGLLISPWPQMTSITTTMTFSYRNRTGYWLDFTRYSDFKVGRAIIAPPPPPGLWGLREGVKKLYFLGNMSLIGGGGRSQTKCRNIQYALNIIFFVKSIFLPCKFSGRPVFVRTTIEIKGVQII